MAGRQMRIQITKVHKRQPGRFGKSGEGQTRNR